MKILAIETSCEYATLALLMGDDIVQHTLEGHANHSERLLPAVKALLGDAQASLGSLDAIAFGAGPGAFTGLRLSCGIAQGLAMGAGLGVVPIGSLEALSLQGQGERIFVATDARMGETYCAAFELELAHGLPVQQGESECRLPGHLELPGTDRWFGIGSAFRVYADVLPTQLTDRLSGCNPHAVPAASDVARLAATRIGQGRILAPELAVPAYVRNKVAFTTAERLARGGRA